MDNPEDNYEYDDQEKPGEEQPGKDPQNEGSDEDPTERFRRLTSRASLPPELLEDGTIGIYRGSPPAENSDEEVEEKPQSEEVPDEEISPNPDPFVRTEFDDSRKDSFSRGMDATSAMAAFDPDAVQADDLVFEGIPEKPGLRHPSLIEETPGSGLPLEQLSDPAGPSKADADTDIYAELGDTNPTGVDESPPLPPPPPFGESRRPGVPALDADDMPLPRWVPEDDLDATHVTPAAFSKPASQPQDSWNYQPPSEKPRRRFGLGERRDRNRGSRFGQAGGCLLRALIIMAFVGLVIVLGVGSFMLVQYYSIAATLPSVEDVQSRTSQFQTTRILDRNGNLLYEILDPERRETHVRGAG